MWRTPQKVIDVIKQFNETLSGLRAEGDNDEERMHVLMMSMYFLIACIAGIIIIKSLQCLTSHIRVGNYQMIGLV